MESMILLASNSGFSSNGLVIVGSLIVIISYLFNLIARRYSVPSVLLLILMGMLLHGIVRAAGVDAPDLTRILEVLGIEKPKVLGGAPVPAAPGKSLVPAFAKDVTIKRDLIWWLHEGNRAVRVGDWKLVAAKNDPSLDN